MDSELQRLGSLLEPHQINLDSSTLSRLAAYSELLKSWNDRVRLVSRPDTNKVLSRHVFESLLLLRFIGSEDRTLVDIGSGGGFPGIPIAIARPMLSVSLVESARMKSLFLADATKQLGLGQVEVRNTRAEDVRRETGSGFDLATSRAVGKLGWVWELAEPLLVPGGRLLALKGPGEAECELGKVTYAEHTIKLEDRSLAVVEVPR